MRTRTSTADLMPVVGFAARGLSIRTLMIRLGGEPLPLHVALDVALSVTRLVRVEHEAGRVVGALDDSRVILMENGMISLMAGGDRVAPELKNPNAEATTASDVYAVGYVLSRLVSGGQADELEQLMSSCLSADPKARPSQLKWVEKALLQFLTEEQMEAALEERIALVKQNTPELAQHLAPQDSRVIATEDVQSRMTLRPRAKPALISVGLVVGALLVGAVWWWAKPSPVDAPPPVTPVAPVEAAAPAPEPAAEEPALAPPAPAAPSAPPPAPVKAKKHRRR